MSTLPAMHKQTEA